MLTRLVTPIFLDQWFSNLNVHERHPKSHKNLDSWSPTPQINSAGLGGVHKSESALVKAPRWFWGRLFEQLNSGSCLEKHSVLSHGTVGLQLLPWETWMSLLVAPGGPTHSIATWVLLGGALGLWMKNSSPRMISKCSSPQAVGHPVLIRNIN